MELIKNVLRLLIYFCIYEGFVIMNEIFYNRNKIIDLIKHKEFELDKFPAIKNRMQWVAYWTLSGCIVFLLYGLYVLRISG